MPRRPALGLAPGQPMNDLQRLSSLKRFHHHRLPMWTALLSLAWTGVAGARESEPLFTAENLPALPDRLVGMLLEWLGAPQWLVAAGETATAAGVVAGLFLGAFALLSLIERKVLARVQNRLGPNRAGIGGILQPVADGIKMITKEDIVPAKSEPFLHFLAPVIMVVPPILALGVLPYGREWVPVPLTLGLVLFFAVGAITEVAVFIAGWSSGSKFPTLGSMRAISQLVSYELPLILATVAVVMVSGTVALYKIVLAQGGGFWNWNVATPWGLVAGLLFLIAGTAEANRTPFDLPEGESEIVAGHMTEYSGFKYALFYMGEYLGMFSICGLGITLFLGGWQAPFPGFDWVPSWLWFFGKLSLVIFVLLWVRATFPRVRMDQLMRFAWLFLVPVGLYVLPVTALWSYSGGGFSGWLLCGALLAPPFIALTVYFNRRLAPATTRRYHFVE